MKNNLKNRKLLAIDPSLTASGWVLFAAESSIPLALGVLSPPGPKHALAKRLDELQLSIEDLFIELKMQEGDLLICEGPAPLVLNPQSALKVEQVRGIFESVARNANITVPGRLNPRTVQSELLGMRGPQLKREVVKTWARETAMQLYGNELEHLWKQREQKKKIPQDVIDAVLIGTLAISKIKLCLQTGSHISEAFLSKNSRVHYRKAANS